MFSLPALQRRNRIGDLLLDDAAHRDAHDCAGSPGPD